MQRKARKNIELSQVLQQFHMLIDEASLDIDELAKFS
jgi:hypothetical protein